MSKGLGHSLPWAIVLATILATGASAVWGLAVIWFGTVIHSVFSTVQQSESLVFTRTGEPLLQSYDYTATRQQVYHQLDGQTVDADSVKVQTSATNSPMPGLRERRIQISSNLIIGFGESRPAPTYWYLTHDETRTRAYLVGYDAHSKMLIGYLGLAGFRRDRPTENERLAFAEIHHYWGFHAGVSGTWQQEPNFYGDEKLPLFLLSDGSVIKIDLIRRTVEAISLPEQALAIADVDEPRAVEDDREAVYDRRIAVRLAERILLLTPQGELLRAIPIPAEIRDANLTVFSTVEGDPILVTNRLLNQGEPPAELYWIDTAGKITRRASVPSRWPEPDPRGDALNLAFTLPAPGVLALVNYALAPMSRVHEDQAPDFRAALAQSWDDTWPAFVAACLLAGALAVVVERRQRRYWRTGTAAWIVFVLFCGPAGLLGYWLHRRWPARESCGQCGQLAPRDQWSCLACGADFVAPARRGSEIFA